MWLLRVPKNRLMDSISASRRASVVFGAFVLADIFPSLCPARKDHQDTFRLGPNACVCFSPEIAGA
jgi:hypothetical protein